MAIQDYVRSIAATETVSKDQVFRFLEMQFARAENALAGAEKGQNRAARPREQTGEYRGRAAEKARAAIRPSAAEMSPA